MSVWVTKDNLRIMICGTLGLFLGIVNFLTAQRGANLTGAAIRDIVFTVALESRPRENPSLNMEGKTDCQLISNSFRNNHYVNFCHFYPRPIINNLNI